MSRFVLLLLVCQIVLGSKVPRTDPLVETSLGLIRGLVSEDGQYSMFLGIPYAVIDEEKPFSEATPASSFDGTFDAYDGSVVCAQQSLSGASPPSGQLQCLNLNVYVPNTASSENLRPVMVYIHGGAFTAGNNGRNPHNFVSRDIVYVSLNYRLGLYGFMCTDNPKAPGNMGLKDQLIALRWVNEHIESFGGDKNKITVFGESAGSMSIHFHLLSSHEKLFDQAIMQSGPATSPFTMVLRDNNIPLKVAENLGFVTDDVEEAIDFIAKADVHQAVAATTQLESISALYSMEPLAKPCAEKEFEGMQRFVEVNANEGVPEKVKTTKVIIGYCSQEMILSHRTQGPEFYEIYSFEQLLQYGYNVTDFNDNVVNLRRFYIGDNATSIDNAIEITNFASDFVFNHPTERAIKAMLAVGPEAIYHYIFSYIREGTNSTLGGAAHASELGFLFSLGEDTEADQKTVDRLVTMWTNFAKYGDPTPEITELLPVKWETITQDSLPYLSIDEELKMSNRPFHDRMAYWDIFYQLNKQHTIWYNED